MKRTLIVLAGLALLITTAFIARDQVAKAHYRDALAASAAIPKGPSARYASLYDPIYTRAQTGFIKALAIRPKNARWHFEYGRLLCRVGRTDQCLAEASIAAALDPTNSDFKTVLLRLEANRRDEALSEQRDTNAEFARTLAEEQAQQQERARILHDR